jgi:two-component system nitrogen regulation response regulator NtrX
MDTVATNLDILIVDDEPDIGAGLSGALEDEGYRVRVAHSGEAGLDEVRKRRPDFVFLDIAMPGGMDGVETLQRLRDGFPDVGVLMVSGHGTIEIALKTIQMGALDFIEKPFSLDVVLDRLTRAASKREQRGRTQHPTAWGSGKTVIVGESPATRDILAVIERVAPTNARVLITGESGTGKELVARAIHERSRRAKRPFVRVNCAAIPSELIESELFGYEKGSFTGAATRHPGRFEQANGGTLFLDEVGDMSAHTQAKVLRVLEEGQFERVGGTETLSSDARVLAATNLDLRREIAAGRFREDLYYRLNVVPIHVPPLRERREDVLSLAEHFLRRYSDENGRPAMTLSPDARDALERYEWRGNIRELRNLMERLVVMSTRDEIRTEDLPSDIREAKRIASPDATRPLRDARDEFEVAYIRRVLDETGWNVSEAAKRLGIERSHLHRKIRQANLHRDG